MVLPQGSLKRNPVISRAQRISTVGAKRLVVPGSRGSAGLFKHIERAPVPQAFCGFPSQQALRTEIEAQQQAFLLACEPTGRTFVWQIL